MSGITENLKLAFTHCRYWHNDLIVLYLILFFIQCWFGLCLPYDASETNSVYVSVNCTYSGTHLALWVSKTCFVFSVILLCLAESDFNAKLIIFVLISLADFQEFPDEGKS